jgi:hypothetical protein
MWKFQWTKVERQAIFVLVLVAICDTMSVLVNVVFGDLPSTCVKGFVYALRIRLEIGVLNQMVEFVKSKRGSVTFGSSSMAATSARPPSRPSTLGSMLWSSVSIFMSNKNRSMLDSGVNRSSAVRREDLASSSLVFSKPASGEVQGRCEKPSSKTTNTSTYGCSHRTDSGLPLASSRFAVPNVMMAAPSSRTEAGLAIGTASSPSPPVSDHDEIDPEAAVVPVVQPPSTEATCIKYITDTSLGLTVPNDTILYCHSGFRSYSISRGKVNQLGHVEYDYSSEGNDELHNFSEAQMTKETATAA